MAARINARQLTRELGVPALDVEVGLCNLKPVYNSVARVYDRKKALDCMEAYYRRKTEENRELYEERDSKIYQTRAEKYAERLNRVHEAMKGRRDA